MRIIVLLEPLNEDKGRFQRTGTAARGAGNGLRIGYHDANALEVALQIKEKGKSGTVEITALTAGLDNEDEVLREALALGVDKAVLINDPGLASADVVAKARCLAAAITNMGDFDLLLAGYQSQDKPAGNVGQMTAEFLDIPQITHVKELVIKENHAEAVSDQAGFFLKLRSEMPCCIVMNKMKNALRNMTLQGVRQAMKKDVIQLSIADISAAAEVCIPNTFVIHQFDFLCKKIRRSIHISGDLPEEEKQLALFLSELKADFRKTS